MKIAIAGGTGLVGTLVVELAEAAGHQVVVLARGRGTDLETGHGVTAALDGVAAVIDVTNVVTVSARRSSRFFSAVTSNLLAAEHTTGVGHHLALSIVGRLHSAGHVAYFAGGCVRDLLLGLEPKGQY